MITKSFRTNDLRNIWSIIRAMSRGRETAFAMAAKRFCLNGLVVQPHDPHGNVGVIAALCSLPAYRTCRHLSKFLTEDHQMGCSSE